MAHLLFVLAQNIQNSEDTWLWNFAYVGATLFRSFNCSNYISALFNKVSAVTFILEFNGMESNVCSNWNQSYLPCFPSFINSSKQNTAECRDGSSV